MRDAPAHDQHQAETKKQERQSGDGVLNADHLVIGGENPFPPEPGFVVIMVPMVVVTMCIVSVCGVSHKTFKRSGQTRVGRPIDYFFAGNAFSSASVHWVVRSANSLRTSATNSGVTASVAALPKLVRT